MDLRQLRYFVKVAEAKSLTRAAELLRLAQPALSNQMLKLENELQQQLLVRHSRGVELTDAGQRLLGHARTILNQVEITSLELGAPLREAEGLVRVGVPRSLAETVAVELIRKLRQEAPAVSIRIVENFSDTLLSLLHDQELDIVLTYTAEHSARTIAEELFVQRLCLVSPKGSLTLPSDCVRFADVMNLPLALGSSRRVVRKLVMATGRDMSLMPDVVHEIDSLQTALKIVEGGFAHTIMPSSLVAKSLEQELVEVRPIVEPELARTLKLVRLNQKSATRAHLIVRDTLLELVRQACAHEPGLRWTGPVSNLNDRQG